MQVYKNKAYKELNLNDCRDLFIIYVNDFQTVEAFAIHYNLTTTQAHHIIDLGAKANKKIKQTQEKLNKRKTKEL